MFDKEVEQLLEEMSSFYKTYLPTDSAYSRLLNAYIESFLALWQEAQYYRSHVALETAPTLQTIKYAKVDINEALYSKREALRIQRFSTLEEKITALTKENKFITFEFSELGSRIPMVYDMELKESFGSEETLTLYEDYFIRNNRMYLMPEYIIRVEHQLGILHAFNIRVDNMMIEKKWGSIFEIETGPLMPRYKYRDIISAFRQVMSGNLSIKEIKEAVTLATGWEEFNIQDRMSPKLRAGLKRLYDDWMISPARFIVTLPEDLIKEKMELNVLLSLLDESKEVHLNYLVLFMILRVDYFDRYHDEKKISMSMRIDDKNQMHEDISGRMRTRQTDLLFRTNRYDTGRNYEFKLRYDAETLGRIANDPPPGDREDPTYQENVWDSEGDAQFDDPQTAFDIPWAHLPEYVKVEHVNFPQIPREAVLAKGVENQVIFTFNTNDDGTTAYELLASKEKYGRYEVVNRFDNNPAFPKNSIIHNETNEEMRYYKIRAIAGRAVSLATVPLGIQGD